MRDALLIAVLATVLSLFATAFAQAETVVADYRDDFQNGSGGTVGVTEAIFSNGWSYLWNQPDGWTSASGVTGDMTTGPVGQTSSYSPLVYTGTGTPWTADANTSGTDHNPDRYVRATSSGGHPGAGVESGNTLDRAVIYAYEIQPDDPISTYALTNTLAYRASTNGDGNRIYVHVNDDPILAEFYVPARTPTADPATFAMDLGLLAPGDVIYVAMGTNGPGTSSFSASSDGFGIDFSITSTPEPSTLAMLLGLGAVGLLGYLRRRRPS